MTVPAERRSEFPQAAPQPRIFALRPRAPPGPGRGTAPEPAVPCNVWHELPRLATPAIIASPASVAPGGLETVTIQNGLGNTTDWVGLYAVDNGFFVNNSSPAANTEFLNGQSAHEPATDIETAASELFEPVPADASFLSAMLDQIRTEQPTLLAPLPSGVTDVRLPVLVDAAITGVHLEAASAGSPLP
jgi:hypothetical protein